MHFLFFVVWNSNDINVSGKSILENIGGPN